MVFSFCNVYFGFCRCCIGFVFSKVFCVVEFVFIVGFIFWFEIFGVVYVVVDKML